MDDVRKLVKRFHSNDPFEISRALNIEIRFEDLGASTRGMYIRKLRRRCIFIHSGLDELWQRFICAHELAHDRLHPGFSRFWLDKQSFHNPGKFERQANRFALKLLTANQTQERDESIEWFLLKCGIPHALHKLYGK